VIRPSALVTHTLSLESFGDAMHLLDAGADHAVGKILIALNAINRNQEW
jgi:hypothetical protein